MNVEMDIQMSSIQIFYFQNINFINILWNVWISNRIQRFIMFLLYIKREKEILYKNISENVKN